MKRFVKILILPIALLLGHTLIYSSESATCQICSVYDEETYFNMSKQSNDSSSSYGEDMTAFKLDRRGVKSSNSKTQESEGHVLPTSNFKKLKTTVTSNALGILKCGKLLNSNKLYDFLNTFSYHTSGVRASVDRLFTLGSVRC